MYRVYYIVRVQYDQPLHVYTPIARFAVHGDLRRWRFLTSDVEYWLHHTINEESKKGCTAENNPEPPPRPT